MKPLFGTLLLALVLFLSSIDYSSTADRPNQEFPENNNCRKRKILTPVQGERSKKVIHDTPSSQFQNIDPVQQEPPRIQRLRDPAHAHLNIDLNRLPPEAFENPQPHPIYQPIARYPSGARYP